jgi:hypothetical protein
MQDELLTPQEAGQHRTFAGHSQRSTPNQAVVNSLPSGSDARSDFAKVIRTDSSRLACALR